MLIVWDEPKRLANIAKHAMDFADLTLEFFAEAMIGPARGDRLYAIGLTLGNEAISVISMRPASPKERRLINA